MTTEPTLVTFEVTICALCLDGVGGECHVPGCAFWMDDAPAQGVARRLHNAAHPPRVLPGDAGEAHERLVLGLPPADASTSDGAS